MDKIAQSDIHNATQRAMVKCVATNWGLGLKLWQKEDREALKKPADDLSFHSLNAIKRRFQEEYTEKLKKHMSAEDIAKGLGKTVDEVKTIFTYFDQLTRFEEELKKL